MRMRYERRDPRAEDLREISELRTRCESQERDLYVLTDRLREMQIQMSEMQQNGDRKGGGKSVKKPPPKSIPTSCDVIYEENEERESPEHENGENSSQGDDDEEEEEIEQEPSDTESNHTIEVNGKSDRINEDDAHLITAVWSTFSYISSNFVAVFFEIPLEWMFQDQGCVIPGALVLYVLPSVSQDTEIDPLNKTAQSLNSKKL